jgi:bacillithiol biosynthesis cysteine-adding enzyme BshC
MDCTSHGIPYRQIGFFTEIVLDYLDHKDGLKPFYDQPPTLAGIVKAIEARKKITTNRQLLVRELKKQYASINSPNAVGANIEALLAENTFTITTAHQPNIFTGPLFFIYKILHVIKLAAHLNTSLSSYKFVPVYFMGSEDADLDELGNTHVDGQDIKWETKQTGAVGRMKVDKEFLKLINLIEGQISVQPFGNEIISLVKDCYTENALIQDATFKLVNELLGEYGIIVFIPDNAALKKQMIPVFKADLLHQTASAIVEKTSKELETLYKIQANPREINLFYLKDNIRERIIKENDKFTVNHLALEFDESSMIDELDKHPELFSPNVILRGLYQCTVLPDIIFVGGGGEIAYWLQLKELYQHYNVPFPVLVVRNSFLIVEKKWQEKISKLHFTIDDFFQTESILLNKLVTRDTDKHLKLNGTFTEAGNLYDEIKKQASFIDSSLEQHVDALKAKTLQGLQDLESKMLRAEKRKYADQQRQIHTIKENLFPRDSLQERHDNFLLYYAKWGREFIQKLYEESLSLEAEFVVITVQ